MPRDEIDYGALDRHVREIITAKAHEALALYTAAPLKRDAGGYPFARGSGRSIRDPQSQSVTPTTNGIRIMVEAPGAQFIEEGNAPSGGGLIKPRKSRRLAVPLRGGAIVAGQSGIAFLKEVKPYEGTDRLLKAVIAAFGIAVQSRT